MLACRAYALYNRAAGGKKLTSVARAPLSNSRLPARARGQARAVARRRDPVAGRRRRPRCPTRPPVVVRELGPRELIEVPLDEIAELMRRLAGRRPHAATSSARSSTPTASIRMTARAEQYLTTAEELL